MTYLTRLAAIIALGSAATACATETPVAQRIANSTPAVTVVARGETVPVGTANDDAADDPAIWRNAANPAASLIVGTDKKAGIYLYDLTGKVLDFNNAGNVNNVDLREGVIINGQSSVLVVASDRNDLDNAKFAVFALDTVAGKLRTIGTVPAGTGEAYGICLSRDATGLYAFLVMKDGTINQVKLDVSGPTPSSQIVRTLKLATQSEGCVVDEVTGRLYVAEEDVGLWRFDASASGSLTPIKIANADTKNIVADAEGVALADDPKAGRFVIVSSQGDNAYSVYRADTDAYVGRFRIAPGVVGATEETDGIEVIVGDFGPAFPGGLFIAQDGFNAAGAQNFKLVAWDDIKEALGLGDRGLGGRQP
jgi:3-phytase